MVEEALQKRTLLYDKAGDEHYGVVSAFIKSMRGSDPDAAVYWMARMLEAGEDPLFVLRRMVIFAAEDVGIADPQALVGRDGGGRRVPLHRPARGAAPDDPGGASIWRPRPSRNTALTTYAAAKADVDAHGALPVPAASAQRAHAARASSWATARATSTRTTSRATTSREEYLPEAIRGHKYYTPSDSGHEAGHRRTPCEAARATTRQKKR